MTPRAHTRVPGSTGPVCTQHSQRGVQDFSEPKLTVVLALSPEQRWGDMWDVCSCVHGCERAL